MTARRRAGILRGERQVSAYRRFVRLGSVGGLCLAALFAHVSCAPETCNGAAFNSPYQVTFGQSVSAGVCTIDVFETLAGQDGSRALRCQPSDESVCVCSGGTQPGTYLIQVFDRESRALLDQGSVRISEDCAGAAIVEPFGNFGGMGGQPSVVGGMGGG